MNDASLVLGYFNDRFLPLSEITISPYDLGFLRGYAVFDVMPVENGKPFLWERHYDRLCRSAKALGLYIPLDKDKYKKLLDELIIRNSRRIKKMSLRIILSGGPSADSFVPEPNKETFIILPEETHRYASDVYEKGVKTITLDYKRVLPQVKLANHAIAISDLPRRRTAGAFETIYVNDGQISEATQSNIFIVKNGKLFTTWENVLWGITQGLIFDLAEELGITVEKTSISLEECLSADEVFITASSKRIVPVVMVDETIIADGKPGKVTRQLIEAFESFVKNF